MNIQASTLISNLIESTKENIKTAETLYLLSESQLHCKASQTTWSALECIEHLNLYGDFYLPIITHCIDLSRTNSATSYKPGILGGYFAKSMLPKDNLNKMKTFKSKNPNGSKLDKTTLIRFLDQQEQLLVLLNKAKTININTIKVPTTLGKLVKLRLGDTFGVVINHNTRHLVQAQNQVNQQKG